jgi:predicted SnoaL-like aldol condensation-catalyzing enzyme
MADLEQNKQTVRAFYEEAFNDGDPEGAVQRYLGDRYVQHNPQRPTARRRSSGSCGGTGVSSPSSAWRSSG